MAANFASLNDVALVLQRDITDPEQIASVDFALLSASAAVRNYTHQLIHHVSGDNIVIDVTRYSPLVFLPQLPVTSIDAVIENNTPLSVVDDYQLTAYTGVLRRIDAFWYLGTGSVAVRYGHGYTVIPDDVRVVTARAASRLFQAGLRSVETAGVPGVVSKQLGDFSVSYGAEPSSEGQLGVSGARLLLLSEKDILDTYRL